MTHKILVVDDEREIREELIEYLSGKGYDCLEASGVSPAMESLHEDPEIAIVVTDIKMPGQDGLDLLSVIKSELEREVEVIVVTGHGGLAEATRALSLARRFVPATRRHWRILPGLPARAAPDCSDRWR